MLKHGLRSSNSSLGIQCKSWMIIAELCMYVLAMHEQWKWFTWVSWIEMILSEGWEWGNTRVWEQNQVVGVSDRDVQNNIYRKRNVYTLHNLVSICTYGEWMEKRRLKREEAIVTISSSNNRPDGNHTSNAIAHENECRPEKWNSLHRTQIINGFAFCMCPKCYVERVSD